jgi:hypothetical protein
LFAICSLLGKAEVVARLKKASSLLDWNKQFKKTSHLACFFCGAVAFIIFDIVFVL